MMTHGIQKSVIRDLVWVMASPSLLVESSNAVSDEYCQSVYQQSLDWLAGLQQQPSALSHWTAQRQSTRLGIYFEQLVAFWLQQRIAAGYFKSHCRVFRDKRVLGEFDFLFTEAGSNTLVHWETAVKFYLRFQEVSGEFRWYGPNARDRLDLKLARMMQHQLCLGQLPEGKALLAAEGFDSVTPKAFLKGYLFYPAQSDWQNPDPLPSGIAAGHLKGWWTRSSELLIPGLDTSGKEDVRWCILPRLQWLSRWQMDQRDVTQLLKVAQLQLRIQEHFALSRIPLLVVGMRRCGETLWLEQNRGFIVDATWPMVVD